MFLRQRNLHTSLLACFLVNFALTMMFIDILGCRHQYKMARDEFQRVTTRHPQGKSVPTQCETHCVLYWAAHDADVPNESDSPQRKKTSLPCFAYGLTHWPHCFLKQLFVFFFSELSLTFECGFEVTIENIWTKRMDGAEIFNMIVITRVVDCWHPASFYYKHLKTFLNTK